MKEHLIVPGEMAVINDNQYGIPKPEILTTYFNIAFRYGEKSLPPVIVLGSARRTYAARREDVFAQAESAGTQTNSRMPILVPKMWSQSSCQSAGSGSRADVFQYHMSQVEQFEAKAAHLPFFLYDGSHRTVASAAAGIRIYAIEPESDEDLQTLYQQMDSGMLPIRPKRHDSLDEALKAFEYHCLDYPQELMSGQHMVEEWLSVEYCPTFMRTLDED